VDVIQCSQQLDADELSTIFSHLLSTNSGGVVVLLALITPSNLHLARLHGIVLPYAP
jgi:hypothetical protein